MQFRYKKILILGDSGRGKTTFAKKLSKKLGINIHSTDDFFYKVKFSVLNDRDQSIKEISSIYDSDTWIVEGGTRHLVLPGLDKADIIFYLQFRNIFQQILVLIKRNISRKNESFTDLLNLIKHNLRKKYKKNYGNHLPRLKDLIKDHQNKVVELSSYKEIDKYLNSIEIY